MSLTAYVVTKDVRHLSAWTQDSEQQSSWRSGSQRPICGEQVRDWTHTLWPNFQYEDETIVRRGMAKPVCKDCRKVLARLVEMSQS